MSGKHEIEIEGETFRVLPERALFWREKQTLLIADLHLGKTAFYCAAGIPVTNENTTEDIFRLNFVLERTGARRLIVLGDFFHAPAGKSPEVMDAFLKWRTNHKDLKIVLVRGNHDKSAGDPPEEWEIFCENEPWIETPLVFRHVPQPHPAGYSFGGHIHPAVTLTGPGRQREKLACFWFGDQVAVLPAFGSFTGNGVIHPKNGVRVFLVGQGEIFDCNDLAGLQRKS